MTIPLERAPGIPALARGLATGTPDVSEFLPRAASLAAVAVQASAARRAFGPRALPAGADPRLAALARGERAGVFTGQQAGLFGGPHLTLAKAVAAEKLAADLAEAGTPATAAFWCATEDHDLVEVTRVVLPTPEGPRDFGPDSGPLASNRAPVGRSSDRCGRRLPSRGGRGKPRRPARRGGARGARARPTRAARTRDAFGRTLDWLLGGSLPLVDAADAADKPALVPLAVRVVKRAARRVRALLQRARRGAREGRPTRSR